MPHLLAVCLDTHAPPPPRRSSQLYMNASSNVVGERGLALAVGGGRVGRKRKTGRYTHTSSVRSFQFDGNIVSCFCFSWYVWSFWYSIIFLAVDSHATHMSDGKWNHEEKTGKWNRQTGRQANKQTGRQTNKQIRQTKQTDRQKGR